MRTWRARTSELFRQWRVARDRRRAGRTTTRDERAAEELERAWTGADRFPPMRG